MSKNEVILGLNGVSGRDHDSAACLIVGGEIVAAAEQERFSRNKKAFDELPLDAVTFCLENAGVEIEYVDIITVGWQQKTTTSMEVLPEKYRQQAPEIPIKNFNHHQAHAASAFYTSPFNSGAILVVDGEGDGESATVWFGSPEGLEKKASFGVDKSLGYLYSSVSKFCGLGTFGAGKVMGLAPYGEPRFIDAISEIYHSINLPTTSGMDLQDEYISYVTSRLKAIGLDPAVLNYDFNPQSLHTRRVPELEQVHFDLASSVQKFLETELLKLAKLSKDLTGSKNLCMAGGVAMNCVANSAIENSNIFEELYLQPACEDSGVALGSSLLELGQKATLATAYLGPKYHDDDIEHILKSRGIVSTESSNISLDTAELLISGLVVGWFQGAMEYGPRALGSRSILAHPSVPGIHSKVSDAKRREHWRPFGPSVLFERGDDLFYRFVQSPYMLKSFDVRPKWRKELEAVVHVDGSTRPQTVTREANPRFYDMISVFDRLTGIPAVLNTSFNDEKEPIVATPDDALRTFYTTGIDALVIGNRIIRKNND